MVIIMNVVKSYVTKNRCYIKNEKLAKVRGLMLHSIGCPQPKATVLVNNFNKETLSACVHAFIDANDGTVYQTLDWNTRGWHAGGSANNTHIGVEMCEPNTIKYTGGSTFVVTDKAKAQSMVRKTYESAVELFAYLCKEYGLNPLTDIISHAEGYRKGIASNHGDPEHLWRGVGLPYTMNGFREDVRRKMADKFEPYLVKINTDVLNVRKGAGTNYPITTTVKKGGVYTIVEVSGTWGKLKSGAGWISLNYTTRV